MSQFISLSEAVAMTTLYRTNREAILDSYYQNQNILPLSESFEREVFDEILSHTGCVGIRVYFGMDENNKVHVIFVGYNSEDEDMVTETNSLTEGDEIAERGVRCPDICPPSSPLNS